MILRRDPSRERQAERSSSNDGSPAAKGRAADRSGGCKVLARGEIVGGTGMKNVTSRKELPIAGNLLGIRDDRFFPRTTAIVDRLVLANPIDHDFI
jgi:hypothetical protein